MEENLRNSGIDIIGDVPWGTNFCQFYQTKEDLTDILSTSLIFISAQTRPLDTFI